MPLSTWAATLSSTCANRSFPMTQNPRLSHESRGFSYVFPAVGEGLSFSNFLGANLRPCQGRSAGPNFSPMRNWGKNRLGRSPLRTSLGYEAGNASCLSSARHPCCGSCLCHHTRPPWAAGPMARWFPHPGLPWRSGVPAAGNQTLGGRVKSPIYRTSSVVHFHHQRRTPEPRLERKCPAMYELEYVRGHVEVFFNGEFCFSADNRREAEAELALLQR